MGTKLQDALELAKTTRKRISEDSKSLSGILRECKTICRYLGISDKHVWIDQELNGYADELFENHGEALKKMPEYRIVFETFKDIFGRPIIMDNIISSSFGKTPLYNSIREIETFTTGMTVVSSPTLDALNSEKFQNMISGGGRVGSAYIPQNQINGVLNGIENKIYEFLDEIILELEYGNVPENIFETIRQEVDEKFTKLCPKAIEKLPVIYEQLSSDKQVTFSQIASTCRQIIKDVADSLYPPQKKTVQKNDKKLNLDESKTINRILARMDNDSEKVIFNSMFEYVDNFLHNLQNYASKGDHSQFTKSDAARCIVYTYILLGDILHYYTKEKT